MEAIHQELRAHIARLALCSVASLGFGVEAIANIRGEWSQGFGQMTLGWAVVNLLICLMSRLGKGPNDLAKFREFLFLNLGLNAAYIGVGTTMAMLGGEAVAGSGIAVVIQGALLLVLDVWLLKKIKHASAGPRPGNPDTTLI